MALLGSPKLVLLDELYAGLDSDDARLMDALLKAETEERQMAEKIALLIKDKLLEIDGQA